MAFGIPDVRAFAAHQRHRETVVVGDYVFLETARPSRRTIHRGVSWRSAIDTELSNVGFNEVGVERHSSDDFGADALFV